MARKNFIARDEEFVCGNCGAKNPKAGKSYRNHCRSCLYSLHVDEDVPGDRASSCGGLMEPVAVEKDKILHVCKLCGKRMRNSLMEDDSKETYLKISLCSPAFRTSWKNM